MTGHRDVRAYGDLAGAMDAALARLRILGADTLVSPLAVGVDQLAATRALLAEWKVEALLPEEEGPYVARITEEGGAQGYAALIERATSTRAPVAPLDYVGLGRALIERCDLVLAVFDPRLADGKAGGTEDVVAHALEAGRRVVHLDPVTGILTEDNGVGADVVVAMERTRPVEAAADARAIGAKGRMRRRAVLIGALSALAVVLAVVPLAYAHWAHGAWSVAEVLALAGAFGLQAYHRRTDARANWVHARTRAELVRRERCLFVGRAGGYGMAGERAETRAARVALLTERMAELGAVAEDKEDATIAQAYGTTSRGTSRQGGAGEPALVAWYRRTRVVDQESWFTAQAHTRHRQALAWERASRVAGVGAALGALAVLFGWGGHGAGGAIAHGAAVALPAVAAACTMVTTIMSDAVDARRYRAASRVLARFRREPADPEFSPAAWIDQVEAFLLGEHLAWRAEMLSRDLEVS